MELSHAFPVRSMVFDEPNLVSHAGLALAMGLATRAGLIELSDRQLTVPGGRSRRRVEGICAGPGPAPTPSRTWRCWGTAAAIIARLETGLILQSHLCLLVAGLVVALAGALLVSSSPG